MVHKDQIRERTEELDLHGYPCELRKQIYVINADLYNLGQNIVILALAILIYFILSKLQLCERRFKRAGYPRFLI